MGDECDDKWICCSGNVSADEIAGSPAHDRGQTESYGDKLRTKDHAPRD
jgi:hypothetical protein